MTNTYSSSFYGFSILTAAFFLLSCYSFNVKGWNSQCFQDKYEYLTICSIEVKTMMIIGLDVKNMPIEKYTIASLDSDPSFRIIVKPQIRDGKELKGKVECFYDSKIPNIAERIYFTHDCSPVSEFCLFLTMFMLCCAIFVRCILYDGK